MSFLQRFNNRLSHHEENGILGQVADLLHGIALVLSIIFTALLVTVLHITETNPYPVIGALSLFFVSWLPYVFLKSVLFLDGVVYAAINP